MINRHRISHSTPSPLKFLVSATPRVRCVFHIVTWIVHSSRSFAPAINIPFPTLPVYY